MSLKRLPGQVALRLGTDILNGLFPPGSRLPDEVTAAHTFQVSRSAYREAIRILGAKRLVESRQKLGTRVTDSATWPLLDSDVMGWVLKGEPSREMVFALLEIRMINEPAAAELAATRRTDADLSTLARLLSTLKATPGESAAAKTAEIAFHTAIIAAAHNPALVSLSRTLEMLNAWVALHYRRSVSEHLRFINTCDMVIKALKDRDLRGARWSVEYLVRHASAEAAAFFEEPDAPDVAK